MTNDGIIKTETETEARGEKYRRILKNFSFLRLSELRFPSSFPAAFAGEFSRTFAYDSLQGRGIVLSTISSGISLELIVVEISGT